MLHDAGFDVVRHDAWGNRLLVEAVASTAAGRLRKLNTAYQRIGGAGPRP
jgi:hypothetical protein